MTTTRNVYLKMKSLTEARALLFQRFMDYRPMAVETLSVPDAVERVLAAPVVANMSSPNAHIAAMDGVAVKAADTYGAAENNPTTLTIGQNAFWVNTGHLIPAPCDAVIMVEHLNLIEEDRFEIDAPAFPWQYVRKMGEDIVATELLFPQNHKITPYCVGALLSGGVFEVTVLKKPLLAIIPTGNELVDWRSTSKLLPGQVLETNSFVLGKMAEAAGAQFERVDMLIDAVDVIASEVEKVAKGHADMVLILGGSSAGSEDFAKRVISELGTILVHGVTMMPGKPVILGEISGKPVFGIPGYPVSAIMAFEQFVAPLIQRMLGQPEDTRPSLEVVPTRKIASKLGLEEFIRVKLGKVEDRIVATPLPRGAGTITSITEADGIIRIPNHLEGISDGITVTAELLRPMTNIQNTIVVVGSHDNTLDLLTNEIRARHGYLTLSSSHVGSLGGLMAIKKKACHLAGAHLLDTTDGTYNTSYVKKYLPTERIHMVTLVYRDQGFIVPKGNPKSITGITDLAREDLSFVNRQAGSGTRILLDYKLSQSNMSPDQISGYANEEFTHMSVAAAVLSGAADVGLGIYAAAKALDLDFIPVVTEQYDLLIPDVHFDTTPIQFLLKIIQDKKFKERVEALGGYHTEKTGHIVTVG